MSDRPDNPSPTEALATQIAAALCDEQIIPLTKRDALTRKLRAGTISASDWRLLIEMGLPRSQEEGDAEKD